MGGLYLEGLAAPEPDTAFGAARYRINAGAWVPYTYTFTTPDTIAASPGDVVELEMINSLRPDCPPYSFAFNIG